MIMIGNWKSFIPILFLLVLFCRCSSQHSGSDTVKLPEEIAALGNVSIIDEKMEAKHSITFAREQVFGEVYPFTDWPASRALKSQVDSMGRVYIPNRNLKTIHVFSPEGEEITRLGRQGRGPGEFVSLYTIGLESGELFAWDAKQLRMNYYSLDSMKVSQTLTVHPRVRNEVRDSTIYLVSTPFKHFGISRDTLLVGHRVWFHGHTGKNYHLRFYLQSRDNRIASDILLDTPDIEQYAVELNSEISVQTILPYSLKPLIDVGPDDHIYFAWTGQPLVKVLNTQGEYHRSYYFHLPRAPLREEDLLAQLDDRGYLDRGVQKMEYPDYWPLLESFVVDDRQNLWVATISENINTYDWWVIANDGSLVTRFSWPRERSIKQVYDGSIYAREPHESGDYQHIVRYQFSLE